jgi:signal transduction histidine kinase/CheY-like chemotaxis protein
MPVFNQNEVFPGDSETSAILRSLDWAKTPLGAVEGWPQSLRTSISICLNSAFPILVWWGPELVMLYNDAYGPIISSKHPRALGARGREIFPEVWETIGPMLASVLDQGEAVRADDLLLVLERNGYPEECYFTFSYSPILDETGGVGGIFTPVHETTERVINERRLKTLSTLAQRRAERSTSVESVCHALGLALATNPIDLPFTAIYLFESESGRAQRGTVSSEVGEGLAPLQVEANAAWPPLETILAGNMAVESTRFLPDEQVPLGHWGLPAQELAVIPLSQAGSDRPRGFLLAALNARKRMDESYKNFLSLICEHLSGAIADAEAFEQERKRAEALAEIDRAKTVFFSNVSHEFRTPLTLMAGPIQELLEDVTLPEGAHERLELAQRNTLRLQKLVNNLLDFSRIEAGRVEGRFEPVDLAVLTQDLVSSFRSAFDRAGLTLEFRATPLLPLFSVDRDMWEKIVLNLLSNAFKFTISGGVRVELGSADDSCVMSVIDTGIGIPASELPKIFKRFERVEGAVGRSFEGTGIGLALVQELVKIHGGTIAVESELGSGTRFTVSIPAGASHLNNAQSGPPAGHASMSARVDAYVNEALRWIGEKNDLETSAISITEDREVTSPESESVVSRKRILVADDNADMRQYLHRLLKEFYEVESVSNGAEALGAIQRRKPDLVLSDVMMPVTDGIALLRSIREDPGTTSVPVILLSARAGEEAQVEGLNTGADDYLIKPFSARELIARVSATLKIAQLRATSESLLREERARLLEVLQQAPAFFALLQGPDHVITLVNPLYSRLINNRDVIGQPVRIALPEAAEQGYIEILDRVFKGEPYVGVGSRYDVFVGEGVPPHERYLDFTYQPLREANGNVSGIIVLGVDVTDRRKSEAALRQSEKLAAAGRLAASIAHEINNPLEAVTNLLYLLKTDRGLSAEGLELLAKAEDELARVSHTANQTLRFYRQSTRPSKVEMAEVLDSVIALHNLRHRNSGNIFIRQYRTVPSFVAFQSELRQVFSNLVGNATDAMLPGGRIVLRIRESTDWRSGRKGVRCVVADDGHGMDRETMKRLFEPFFSTKGMVGTGLGLWVGQEIVEKHGGFLRVRSSKTPARHGTVFSVFLPIQDTVRD